MNIRILCIAAVAVAADITCANAQRKSVTTVTELKRADDVVVTPRDTEAEEMRKQQAMALENEPWEKRADVNGNGRVEPAEVRIYRLQVIDINHDGSISVEERRGYYEGWKRIVRTEEERKYDANADGFLEWPEAREFFKERLTIINTEGKAIVNTDIEREFDENCDGMIDGSETAGIQEALE